MQPASGRPATTPAIIAAAPKKLAFVDAMRGVAVLMVIAYHTGGAVHLLPYPVKRLTMFGSHGVQLFFLLSCVTLMLSWHSDEARGRADVLRFWARRVFRIAPMYYFATIAYLALEPPVQGFDLDEFLASLFFVNAWDPTTVPYTKGWQVVPGGWSIGVEFTFYFIFPLIVAMVRSLRGALVFTVLALAIGCLANVVMREPLVAADGTATAERFLYFWFPNQLPVFALGTVLYFVLRALWTNPGGQVASRLHRDASTILMICGVAMVLCCYLPFQDRLPFAWPTIVPQILAATLIFMLAIAVLALAPVRLLVNPLTCAMGRVSFSAYIIHFDVLRRLPKLFPPLFAVKAEGYRAILALVLLYAAVAGVTFALSWVTYTWIETPMIDFGRKLLGRSDVAPATA